MTTGWQGIAKYGWESPAHFSKNEQRAEIQSSQEGIDLNWLLKRKTHLQEHQWTWCLTPTWNHKEEMVCQVTWIPSNTGTLGQRIQKARGQWNLYHDLHLICDPDDNYGNIGPKSFPTQDRCWKGTPKEKKRTPWPKVSLQMGNKPDPSWFHCEINSIRLKKGWSSFFVRKLFNKLLLISWEPSSLASQFTWLWENRHSHRWEESTRKN